MRALLPRPRTPRRRTQLTELPSRPSRLWAANAAVRLTASVPAAENELRASIVITGITEVESFASDLGLQAPVLGSVPVGDEFGFSANRRESELRPDWNGIRSLQAQQALRVAPPADALTRALRALALRPGDRKVPLCHSFLLRPPESVANHVPSLA